MSTSAPAPTPHLPLTPAVFAILLALADGEKHGYAIMLEARQHTPMGPGTLYGSIDRLLAAGLIAETGFTDDERTLLEVFCSKIAIGFDNVCLYEDLAALNNTLEQQVAERTREAQEKSRLLEATLSSMSDGLIAFDDSGRMVVHNHRALELLDLPQQIAESGLTQEEVEARITRQIAARPEAEGAIEEIEFPGPRIVQLRRTRMTGGGQVTI